MTPERPRRNLLGWAVVACLAAGVAVAFLWEGEAEAPKKTAGGPRATAVAVAAVTRGDLAERVRYPGELDADAADLASFFSGRIDSIEVRVGDRVEPGQVLARLDPVDLNEQVAQAKAQVAAAQADERRVQVDVAQGRRELARLESLAKQSLVSKSEAETQRAAVDAARSQVGSAAARAEEAKARVALLEKRLAESAVVAPFAGVIAERYVDPGAVVSAGARLVRLVAERPLWVRFEVPEHEVPLVKAGARVGVTTRGGSDVEAVVRGLAGEVLRDRRVAVAEAVIEEPPAGWLPGMFAEAHVPVRTVERGLLVPEEAVLNRLTGARLETGVFVEADGVARWVRVQTLARDGDLVAVAPQAAAQSDAEAGSDAALLVEGAKVLRAGHVDLNDGAAVRFSEAQP